MKRKVVEYLFVILILSPLLFINNRSSHDWGDDFAGYINEAKNIVEGKPFYETKMLPQDYAPSYAPEYYSYGFPLLLAPVIRVFGVNFRAFDFYMSVWIVLWGLLVFYYLRGRFSFFTSASFVFIFFVNPFFFHFKTEIISDIPFSFFFMLSMLLFIRRHGLTWITRILFGLVIAFTIGIRDLGWFFPALIGADILLSCFLYTIRQGSRAELMDSLNGGGVILVSSGVFIFVFTALIFRNPGSQLHHFASLYTSPSYWDTFIFNLDVYTRLFQSLFHHEVGRYTFALYYSTAFILVLTVVGFIHLLFSRYRWELLLLIAYGFIVLLFPFSTQGFRYLLPVLPILMLCAIYGARSIKLPVQLNKHLAGLAFVLFISFVNIREIKAARASQKEIIAPGPMTDDSKAAIDYIKTNLPSNALIATVKPRAIMFFTDRHTCLIPKNATRPFISDQLKLVHPDYLLHLENIYTNVVNDLAAYSHDSLIWEHAGYKIYKCRKD